MKKGDFAAIFLVLALAGGIFAVGLARPQGNITAVIMQDGAAVRRVAMSSDMPPLRVEIGGKYTNIICFEDGEAWFEQSDCPHQTCVQFGRLSRAGQSAVCTENRVVLTLEGGQELDAVVK